MKIIIIGAGEVGYYLAKRLISEDHNVTIIEMDSERHRRAAETPPLRPHGCVPRPARDHRPHIIR